MNTAKPVAYDVLENSSQPIKGTVRFYFENDKGSGKDYIEVIPGKNGGVEVRCSFNELWVRMAVLSHVSNVVEIVPVKIKPRIRFGDR